MHLNQIGATAAENAQVSFQKWWAVRRLVSI